MHRRIAALFATLLTLTVFSFAPRTAFAADEGTLGTVYLGSYASGGIVASDENDGATEQTPVATFERAKELLATDGTIVLNGAIFVEGETATFSLEGKGDAHVERRELESSSGAMFIIEPGSTVTFDHITLDNGNREKASDSLMLIDGPDTTVTLGDGARLINSATSRGQFGSAVYCDGATLIMDQGAEVSGNTTTGAGYGAIFLCNGSSFEMRGGTISDNVSNRGGAVGILGSSMEMSGGTISGNRTYGALDGDDSYGGAIYISNYEAQSGLPGSENGWVDADARFTMTGGTISNNEAGVYGGAICTYPTGRNSSTHEVYVDIKGGTIKDNEAGSGGGAIAAFEVDEPSTHLTISGGDILDNTASHNGGGIFVYGIDEPGNVTMSGGTISGNGAGVGGGIQLYQGSHACMSITGGSIVDNNRTTWGGGAYIGSGCTLTITGGTIEGNNGNKDQSTTLGDGVYVGGTFEVEDGENGGPVIDQDNDVYLPSGHVIDVIGAFSGATTENPINITSEDLAVEPKDAATPGTKLVNYHDESGGVDAASKADEDGIYVPSAKMYKRDATLVIGKSVHDSQLNYMTYVTEDPTLTLEVLDMTAYTGGDSHDSDPFPAPRYRVRMNAPLASALGEDGLAGLTLTDASGDEVELVEASDGVVMIPDVDETYTFQGMATQRRSARSGAADDAEAGLYEVGLAAGEALEAETDAGADVVVEVDPGTLTVRYVNDADEVASGAAELTSAVLAASDLASSDASSFRAVVDDSAVFSTNNRAELGLAGTDGTACSAEPALLADELLLADDGSSREPAMRAKAERYLASQGIATANRSWDFQYLDLVNAHDGNAWLASSTGADIYWPYPAGTDENTEFTLVRYSDLYREYGINGVEAIDDALATTELSTVAVENTPYGIKFHVDTNGYGPFALSWVSDGARPGGTPEEPSTPAAPQAPNAGTTPHGAMPETGDDTLMLVGVAAVTGLAALASGAYVAARQRRQQTRR